MQLKFWPSFVALLIFSLLFGPLCLAQGHDHGPQVTSTHIITHHDKFPRFCASPTVTAIADGPWSLPSTWSSNTVPGTNARVSIPMGMDVIYDVQSNAELHCIEVAHGASLSWKSQADTRLKIVNIQVLPGGAMHVGNQSQPIAVDKRAEIVFLDQALDITGVDPSQYGNGLHVFGTIRIHGRSLAETFIRFSQEPKAGESILKLATPPVAWRVGDRLLIPDTRQIPFTPNRTFASQAEDNLIISAINGTEVSLTGNLEYDHLGPRDADGNVGAMEISMLPHVGNLTRNVIFRSESLAETSKLSFCTDEAKINDAASCVTRGHIMFLGRADVDVRYALFKDLGRTTNSSLNNTTYNEDESPSSIGTNQVGRYSMHLHHLIGPLNPSNEGYQFTVIGNVIDGFLKWGITVHGAHYGLVRQNVLYAGTGSAIATEDGNESFNVFEKNFIVHTRAKQVRGVMLGAGRAGLFQSRALFGVAKDGFWFSGMHNYVRDNVAANTEFGYNYNGYYLTQHQRIPKYRGANTAVSGQFDLVTAPALLEFTRNEAYGATAQGLWMGWSRGCCTVRTYEAENVLSHFRGWHFQHSGVETYHESRNTFIDFVLRNNSDVSRQSSGTSVRFTRGFNMGNSSYENGETIIRDSDIQGFNIGVRMTPRPVGRSSQAAVSTIEDSFFKNHLNVSQPLAEIHDVTHYIRNVVFETVNMPNISGQPPTPLNIDTRYVFAKGVSLRGGSSKTFLLDFNGDTSKDYEIFFNEQASNFPIPGPAQETHASMHGCPEDGLTNLECLSSHGVSVLGHIAPCDPLTTGAGSCEEASALAASLGVKGLAFAITEGVTPRANILSPESGARVTGATVAVAYQTLGDLPNGTSVSLKLDSGSVVTDLSVGTRNFILENVPVGGHTLRIWIVDSEGLEISGSGSSITFTTESGVARRPNSPTNIRIRGN